MKLPVDAHPRQLSTALDPISPRVTSDLLREAGVRPQKRLGQNFLVDGNTRERILNAAGLEPEDRVLEIGSGLGALTVGLAARASKVMSLEIDRHLEPALRRVVAPLDNVHLVFADYLLQDPDTLMQQAFDGGSGVVVGNIPYSITTAIVTRLLNHKERIRRILLLVQEEFARRMVSAPAEPDYGAMSVFAQYHAKARLAGVVPPSVFIPPPAVSSAMVILEPVVPGTVAVHDESRFFHIVRAAFGQRRKTLLNALMRAPKSFGLGLDLDDRRAAEALLEAAGVDGRRRGETLSVQEFAQLANTAVHHPVQ